jgi:hypothetical protein
VLGVHVLSLAAGHDALPLHQVEGHGQVACDLGAKSRRFLPMVIASSIPSCNMSGRLLECSWKHPHIYELNNWTIRVEISTFFEKIFDSFGTVQYDKVFSKNTVADDVSCHWASGERKKKLEHSERECVHTKFLRGLHVAEPRGRTWNIKNVAEDGPARWSRWVTKSPSAPISMCGAKGNEERQKNSHVEDMYERKHHCGQSESGTKNLGSHYAMTSSPGVFTPTTGVSRACLFVCLFFTIVGWELQNFEEIVNIKRSV